MLTFASSGIAACTETTRKGRGVFLHPTTLSLRAKDGVDNEREIFAVSFDNGTLVPIQPRYWDLQAGGTTSVFLRNPWIGA
jgi:hypothetical protein